MPPTTRSATAKPSAREPVEMESITEQASEMSLLHSAKLELQENNNYLNDMEQIDGKIAKLMEKKLDRKKRHNETTQLIREGKKKEENFAAEPPIAPTASAGADTSNGVGVADGSNATDTASATSAFANNTSVVSASSNNNGSDGGAALLTASNTNDPSNNITSNANNSTSSIGASLDNNLLMPQLTTPILPPSPPLRFPTSQMDNQSLYIFGMDKFIHTALCLMEIYNHTSEELKCYHENQFTANRDPQQEMLQKQELYAKLVDGLNTAKTQWSRAVQALEGGNRLGMENLLNYDIPVDDEDDDATDAAVA